MKPIWYIVQVHDRPADPKIIGLHADFHGATAARFDPKAPMSSLPRPLELVKNVHELTPIFAFERSLIVAEPLLSQLRGVCPLEHKPVKFVQTYRFPFRPGDFAFRNDSAFTTNVKWFEQIALRFARKYSCKYDGPTYHELLIPEAYALPEFDDWQTMPVPDDEERGTDERDVSVSRKATTQFGVVHSFGFVVSDAFWQLTKKYFSEPYFVARKLLG